MALALPAMGLLGLHRVVLRAEWRALVHLGWIPGCLLVMQVLHPSVFGSPPAFLLFLGVFFGTIAFYWFFWAKLALAEIPLSPVRRSNPLRIVPVALPPAAASFGYILMFSVTDQTTMLPLAGLPLVMVLLGAGMLATRRRRPTGAELLALLAPLAGVQGTGWALTGRPGHGLFAFAAGFSCLAWLSFPFWAGAWWFHENVEWYTLVIHQVAVAVYVALWGLGIAAAFGPSTRQQALDTSERTE